MRSYSRISAAFLAIFLISAAAYAPAYATDELTSNRVKSDLEESISKTIPRDSFIVHVFTETETVSEKKISEGEVFTQSTAGTEIKVPPLPGFEITPPKAPEPPSGQSRQTYRMVDKDVLKSVRVQVDFDKNLDPASVDQAKDLVRNYLEMSFGNKATYNFGSVRMMAPAASTHADGWDKFLPYLPWIIASALFLGMSALYLRRNREPEPNVVYPEVMSESRVSEAEVLKSAAGGSGNRRQMALPSGSFPALPANADFIDRRSELLQSFLKNSEIFRIYYEKLSEAAQIELYTGLRGPAFDSLLETLNLKCPKGNENSPPPSEEQMHFYQKNFLEFIETNSWQHSQFFGFLRQLTTEQLTTLVKNENPVVAALILKFCKPESSAAVLPSLTSNERTEILSQFARVKSLSSDELSLVEISVREKVAKLPKLLVGYNQQDEDYWAKVLSFTVNQEELLIDLEKSRPELYPALAKFRFKLEDMPSLPTPLVHQVLDEINNEDLALALLRCPKPVVDFALAELSPDRRRLISGHLGMYDGMPADKVQHAKLSVTLKFREVMA